MNSHPRPFPHRCSLGDICWCHCQVQIDQGLRQEKGIHSVVQPAIPCVSTPHKLAPDLIEPDIWSSVEKNVLEEKDRKWFMLVLSPENSAVSGLKLRSFWYWEITWCLWCAVMSVWDSLGTICQHMATDNDNTMILETTLCWWRKLATWSNTGK